MKWEKGESGNPSGRPAGSKQPHSPKAIRDALIQVFFEVGGAKAVRKWLRVKGANKLKRELDPARFVEFMKMLARMLPKEMEVSGSIGVMHELSPELDAKLDEVLGDG